MELGGGAVQYNKKLTFKIKTQNTKQRLLSMLACKLYRRVVTEEILRTVYKREIEF